MEVNEYNIPVPWGHIAVKTWGCKEDPLVLATHGIQDNAGIFDRIIPLLPKCFYYMCPDLPGHGRSSRYPTQMLISPIDGVVIYKMILDYLGRKEYILLGHSWGAHTIFMFAQLYPEYVLKVCLIDGIFAFPVPADMYQDYWQMRINRLIYINENNGNKQQQSYTYEEALERLINNRLFGGITKSTAICLLERCLTPIENGKFVFTTDPRLKMFLFSNYDMQYIVELTKKYPIRCPMLLLKASLSEQNIWSKYQPILEEVKKFPKCQIQELVGNHDDFSNEPEPWAVAISKFLCKAYSKL